MCLILKQKRSKMFFHKKKNFLPDWSKHFVLVLSAFQMSLFLALKLKWKVIQNGKPRYSIKGTTPHLSTLLKILLFLHLIFFFKKNLTNIDRFCEQNWHSANKQVFKIFPRITPKNVTCSEVPASGKERGWLYRNTHKQTVHFSWS